MWINQVIKKPEGLIEEHIAPWCDIHFHWLDMFCDCLPWIEAKCKHSFKVIHNSYDGREADERKINAPFKNAMDC